MCILCVLNKTFELKKIDFVDFSLHSLKNILIDTPDEALFIKIPNLGRHL